MRKNFKNENKSWRVSTLTKTTALLAMLTATFALTACGSEDTPEEKFKSELKNAVENIENSMNDAATSKETETTIPNYIYEDGVLTVNVDTIFWSDLLKEAGISADDVEELIFAGESTKARGCSIFKNVKKVTFGDGVTTICEEAFVNCDKLETVIMADSVTTIESNVFLSCDSLSNIEFSANLDRIGNNAFHDCISLTTLHIPASVTLIGNQAFESCQALTTVTLEEGLVSIGNSAFAGAGISELNIPSTVTYVGEFAMSSCQNLTSIIINEGIEKLNRGILAECPNLISVILPASLTFIDENPMSDCNEALTVYGQAGSLAEQLANDYGIFFVAQ